MSEHIQAIETRYAGCRFRSRLEARWAVFFDALDVPWEHEPEGFETSAGRYLPDFRIEFPHVNISSPFTYFEVKPPSAPEDPRHRALTKESYEDNYLIVARGMARNWKDQFRQDYLVSIGPAGKHTQRVGFGQMPFGPQDEFVAVIWTVPWAEEVIGFNGRDDWGDVTAAYTKARSARFEHGRRR